MAVDAYISPQVAERIALAKARLFETSKAQGRADGRTINLVFWIDPDQAPPAGETELQEVLVVIAGGANRRIGGAPLTTVQGEFRKEAPFNVQQGARFTLPETYQGLGGVSGYISEPPVDAGAYIRAPFKLEG